jgi:hypothetical protein
MGPTAESLEKNIIFLKKGDEIRRLDGTRLPVKGIIHYANKGTPFHNDLS